MHDAMSLPDITALFIQEIGALLFGMVFLFLYRQSKVVYFGLWSIAWVLRFLAVLCGYELLVSNGQAGWFAPYAAFEFAFVIVLISAARAGFASEIREYRTVLRLIAVLPIFVALVYIIGRRAGLEAYQASNGVVLGFVYFYNFITLRKHQGLGSRIFRFSLLVLGIAFLEQVVLFLYLYHNSGAPPWAQYLRHETYIDFALHCVLAFAAMAMWSESQIDRIRDLTSELDFARRETHHGADLDRLTGLLNQAALLHRMEKGSGFDGVVAVCDMDSFNEVNNRYGHLVGDEVLRNIGHLLQASIRHEDEAFRWGGDEFVVLFHDQHLEVARKRMEAIEARLRNFRVRGYGVLPISFSWGTAEANGRSLRDALDEADRNMFAFKRARSPQGVRDVRPR
jgi:diguanylate cyclase (GGDEF)-like protein